MEGVCVGHAEKGNSRQEEGLMKDKIKGTNSYFLIKEFGLYVAIFRNHLITRRLYKF